MLPYPASPSATATEWPGTAIGLSNTITREKSPDEGGMAVRSDFDDLREKSVRSLAGHLAFVHDGIFLGLRVRLFTNSPHLVHDFIPQPC